MGKKYYYKPKRKRNWLKIFWVFFFIWIFGEIGFDFEELLAIMALGGMAYGGYKLLSGRFNPFGKQATLKKHNIQLRLQDLKDAIRNADKQVSLLEDYWAKKSFTQYGVLARQLLPQIENIKQEANQLKDHLDWHIYKRITAKAEQVEQNITLQLRQLDLPTETKAMTTEEERVMTIAPEILTTYRSIQKDHQTILDKIKTADNQIELQALHEMNMKRFVDILDGYLKIKESPKNFHNADERLAKARQAIEQFDLDLDKSLRELNERDLADFDVSLRMMTKPSHDPLQDKPL